MAALSISERHNLSLTLLGVHCCVMSCFSIFPGVGKWPLLVSECYDSINVTGLLCVVVCCPGQRICILFVCALWLTSSVSLTFQEIEDQLTVQNILFSSGWALLFVGSLLIRYFGLIVLCHTCVCLFHEHILESPFPARSVHCMLPYGQKQDGDLWVHCCVQPVNWPGFT